MLKMNFIFNMLGWYSELLPMLQKRIDDQPTLSRQMVREAQEILDDPAGDHVNHVHVSIY